MRRLAIAVFGALAFGAAPAHAATFQVNTTADNTVCNAVTCSLRGAFLAARGNGAARGRRDQRAGRACTRCRSCPPRSASSPVTDRRRGRERHVHPADRGQPPVQPAAGDRAHDHRRDGPRRAAGDRRRRQHRGRRARRRSLSAGVRVFDGRAPGGGGISASGSTGHHDLAQPDRRQRRDRRPGEGGGIWMPGQTNPTQLTITDSTITGNNAASGGAIATTNNSPTPPENRHTSLRGVTIAFNTARDGGQGGVGGIQTDSSAVRFQGSRDRREHVDGQPRRRDRSKSRRTARSAAPSPTRVATSRTRTSAA